MHVKIGTRKSKLALIQTDMVVAAIKSKCPNVECEIVPVITSGDKITDKNLYDIGGKALFLKELEEQLLAGKIDIAVHSLKDVPGILPEELEITAVLEREDPRDCFVSLKYKNLNDLPMGARVGSSSVRRKVIIHQQRPDLDIVQFRGNIHTRLKKLKQGEVDATILACAGLIRAGEFNQDYCHPIAVEQMLPAAAQGIIGVETRRDDSAMRDICNKINHQQTWLVAEAERSFLTYLDASCRTPLSAYAILLDNQTIFARYMLADFEGSFINYCEESKKATLSAQLGVLAAKKLLRS